MGLFKPKAPKAPPADAAIHYETPPRRYVHPEPLPELDVSIKRITSEIARLREIVAEGIGARSLDVLRPLDAAARADNATAGRAWERVQRQLGAGVVEDAAEAHAAAAFHRGTALIRTYSREMARREAADEAQVEIGRIQAALFN